MNCRQCGARLRVERRCCRVRLKCSGCEREYQIHEVAAELDPATEAELERYSCLIYD